MSERFGIPDHAPQHAPDHALKNPTPQGSAGNAANWPVPPSGPSGYSGGVVAAGPVVQLRKNMLLAVVLATVLGPLGLFYVSFINGVAALLVLPPVVRGLAGAIASSVGGSMDTVRNVAIPVLWCFTIPWSIVGTRWRNRRIDRSNASIARREG
jgi:hypothetical protein